MPAHFQHEHGKGEDEANPEATCHVSQLRTRAALRTGHFRFESHAADRTGAGMILSHFRVHRAGPDLALRVCVWDGRRFANIAQGIGRELCLALAAAKIESLAAMLGAMRRAMRIDHHTADGIAHVLLHLGGVMIVTGIVHLGSSSDLSLLLDSVLTSISQGEGFECLK